MKVIEFIIKGLREIVTRSTGYPSDRAVDFSRVDYFDEVANDYIFSRIDEALNNQTGLALCKFGSIELANIVAKTKANDWHINDYIDLIKGYPIPLYRYKEMERLHINAGFFPQTEAMIDKFVDLMLQIIPDVDILASYVYCERYIDDLLKHCIKVNLDGYYAPFMYKNPWSRVLKDKKILVIHPFTESIAVQYEKRAHIHRIIVVFSEIGCPSFYVNHIP